jgi:hypothetical protein
MKIFEYSSFLLEKKVYQLLLEAKIEFMDDFKSVLKKVNHPIAKDLLGLIGKDLDVSTNFLDLSDKPDSVSFYNPNQVIDNDIYEIIDNGETYATFKLLFKLAGYKEAEFPSLPNGTKGKILKLWNHENASPVIQNRNIKIAEFKSLDGDICFIDSDIGLKKVTEFKGKPQESKIGRLSKRILDKVDKKYSAQDVEAFVNKFKSMVELQRNRNKLFELVNGNDIAYWYLGDRYIIGNGSLQGSCMRYEECQEYFGIYTQNKDKVSLLILKDYENEDKIAGRAIVWKLDDGNTFMDRIYYTKEEEVELFKNYARENGWLYKSKQNMQPNEDIEIKEGSYYEKQLKITLDIDFDYFPYMDTMRYLFYQGFLSNINRIEVDGKTMVNAKTLDSTEGGNCNLCGGNEEVTCGDCDGSGEIECDECSGSGEQECGECDGRGEIKDDDGEWLECEECSGSGEVSCDECGGNGEIECGWCDGSGEIECPECQ